MRRLSSSVGNRGWVLEHLESGAGARMPMARRPRSSVAWRRPWARVCAGLVAMGVAGALMTMAEPVPKLQSAPGDGDTLTFTSRSIPVVADSIAVGDMDLDGDLDVVGVRDGGPGAVYFNSGKGVFDRVVRFCDLASRTNPIVGCDALEDSGLDVAVADMNDDGYLDIVVAGPRGGHAVWIADWRDKQKPPYGEGMTFGEDTAFIGVVAGRARLAIGEVLDEPIGFEVVVANTVANGEAGVTAAYINNGVGELTFGNQVGTLANPTDVLLADFSEDVSVDVVVSNGSAYELFLAYNPLPNAVNVPVAAPSAAIRGIAAGNVDGDDDLDLVGDKGVLFGDSHRGGLYARDPSSTGGPASGCSPLARDSIALADLDLDGDLDCVSGRMAAANGVAGALDIGLNDGRGSFTPHDGKLPAAAYMDHVLADFDADGFVDILVAFADGLPGRLLVNGGAAPFEREAAAVPTPNSPDGERVERMWLANIEEELPARTQLDLIMCGPNSGPHVILDIGDNPTAGPEGKDWPDGSCHHNAIADFNQDGTLDYLWYQDDPPSSQARLYRSFISSTTNETDAGPPGERLDPHGMLLAADIDGEEGLDIVRTGRTVNGQSRGVIDILFNDLRAHPVFDHFSSGRLSINLDASYTRLKPLAASDMDGDGDPDLLVAGEKERERDPIVDLLLMLNLGGTEFAPPAQLLSERGGVTALVADLNGDGAEDIVGGDQVMLNNGLGAFPEWRSLPSGTLIEAVADINGDGSNDLVDADADNLNVFINDGSGRFVRHTRRFEARLGSDILAGDIDQDGDIDLVSRGEDGIHVLRNARTTIRLSLPNDAPVVASIRPGGADQVGQTTGELVADGEIPVEFGLFDTNRDPARIVRASYSPSGGGAWQPAVAVTLRDGAPVGDDGVNTDRVGGMASRWDVLASGFFGQSDNTAFRIEAFPSYRPQYRTVAFTPQHPYNAAQTNPFRVRAMQVRVVEPAATGTPMPIENAIVYRIKKGQKRGGEAIGNRGRAFRTNRRGYLEGRGEVRMFDALVALKPVLSTGAFTLYHTSAPPRLDGLASQMVSQSGVQTVTISPDNRLLLYNLEVALEWDARADDRFMTTLDADLKRASELLFDWTNGQVALGDVTVSHDARLQRRPVPGTPDVSATAWDTADIRVYATNRLRPNSDQGGVVAEPLEDPDVANHAYAPGQVRMGAVWSRYGDNQALGDDWPRALAHELGHYLLFLDDTYLGRRGADDLLITMPSSPPNGCPGAMNDPYTDANSELHPTGDWLPRCGRTLPQLDTGRSDWQTIARLITFDGKPMLKPPAPTDKYADLLKGPNLLPLGVTRVRAVAPAADSRTLAVPIYKLVDANGPTLAGPRARVFLHRIEREMPANTPLRTRLIDLGQPERDEVLARGAEPGDRLCVQDVAPDGDRRNGCVDIKDQSGDLTLYDVPGWRPQVKVFPKTLDTLEISVDAEGFGALAPGQTLYAQLYPADDESIRPDFARTGLPRKPLSPSPDGHRFTAEYGDNELWWLPIEGLVRVWVETAAGAPDVPARELVMSFGLGGSPASRPSPGRPGRPFRSGWRRYVPAASADGTVVLEGDSLGNRTNAWWLTIQTATHIPSPPPWLRVVGEAYWIHATENTPDLDDISVSFNYLGADVPADEEPYLHLYFWDEAARTWTLAADPALRPPQTHIDTDYNVVVARSRGPGMYALMSAYEVPLAADRWNLISYPVPGERDVVEAMRSIAGAFSVMYGYAPDEIDDPWKVYGPQAPDWVNDLRVLAFARGYWVRATAGAPPVIRFRGVDSQWVGVSPAPAVSRAAPMAADADQPVLPSPPATFYGHVGAGNGFTPAPDLDVAATIDGHACGAGKTLRLRDGAIAYVVDVLADGASPTRGCGADGRVIRFTIGGAAMAPTAMWRNDDVWPLDLVPLAPDAPPPPPPPPSSGTLHGVARLQGRTRHAGTKVGTGAEEATTTDDGRYRFDTAPGTHVVTATHASYLPVRLRDVSVTSSTTTTLRSITLPGGDASGDWTVDIFDLVFVVSQYEKPPPFDPRADLNADGIVDLYDLVLVTANYRRRGVQDPDPTPTPPRGDQPLAVPEPFAGPCAAAPGQTGVWLTRPPAARGGDVVTVFACAAQPASIAGFDLRLAYDASSLRLISARPGVPVDGLASGDGWYLVRNAADVSGGVVGDIRTAAAWLRSTGTPPAASRLATAGVISELTFRATADRRPRVWITAATLATGDGTALPERVGAPEAR